MPGKTTGPGATALRSVAGRRSRATGTASRRPPRPATRKLAIDVVWSDIKTVEADVLLVGHYLDVLPQTTEWELDKLASGRDGNKGKYIITELTRRRALRGDLGEVVFFPGPKGRVVALAGMGRLGTFRGPQVGVLARAVGQVVGLLPGIAALATVLIGSGKGNLKVEEAMTPFLEGLAEVLAADGELRLDRLRFVELRLDRALEIFAAVNESAARFNSERKDARIVLAPATMLAKGTGGTIPADFGCSMMLAALARASNEANRSDVGGALETVLTQLPGELRKMVRVRLRELHGKRSGHQGASLADLAMRFRLREPEGDGAPDDVPSRVAFWQSDNDIRAAAITNTTTVVERAIPRRARLVMEACERLQNPHADKVKADADSLYRLLVPAELREVLRRPEPLVVEVDRPLAGVQWEMLPGLNDPLGVVRQVARQLRTFYSPRPFDPGARQQIKALVIGDASGPPFVLDDARQEAREVADVLRSHNVEPYLMLGAPEDGTGAGVEPGVPPADYFQVIDRLLSGEFDIVHYCGHATFEAQAPDRTGWVFKAGVLTGSELEGMERPPRLVVANACLSAQVSQQLGKPAVADATAGSGVPRGDAALVAGLADEFFKQGVSDYIGAAWEVPSLPAKVFVKEFYSALLSRTNGVSNSIGAAVLRARKALYDKRKTMGVAWGAYQHYGDPTRSIFSGSVDSQDG